MVTSNQNLLRVGPKAGTLWSLLETFHSKQAWLIDEEGNVLQEFCIHYTVSSIIVKHKKEKWNYHHMISESPKGLLWQPVFPQWLEQCLSRKCLQIYWMVRWLEQENVRSLRARTLVCLLSECAELPLPYSKHSVRSAEPQLLQHLLPSICYSVLPEMFWHTLQRGIRSFINLVSTWISEFLDDASHI